MILSLFVLGCGQEAPTVSNQNEIDPQVSSNVTGNPNGSCCPPYFVLKFEPGNSTDLNGDDWVCQMDAPGGTVIIDNNFIGDCITTCPPNCGGGGV